ncbi:MAG: hypothetical protein WCG31_00470 [Deltaproteobacteria bacterium]
MNSTTEYNCDFTVRKSRFKRALSALLFASGLALLLFGVYVLSLGLSEDVAVGDFPLHGILLTVKAIVVAMAALTMLSASFLTVLFWSKDALVTFGEIRKDKNGWVTVSCNGKRYKIFKVVFGRTYLVPIDAAGVTVIPTYELIPENPHAFAHAFIRLTSTFASKIIKLAKSYLN